MRVVLHKHKHIGREGVLVVVDQLLSEIDLLLLLFLSQLSIREFIILHHPSRPVCTHLLVRGAPDALRSGPAVRSISGGFETLSYN